MFSRFLLCLVCFRIDKKDSRQLNINKMIATKVISSITVCCDFPNTFNDVRRRKQIPKRLDDVFRMWGDLSMLIIENLTPFVANTFVSFSRCDDDQCLSLPKLKGFHMIFFPDAYCQFIHVF